MGKRKAPTYRTPGTLDPFTRGEAAADALRLPPLPPMSDAADGPAQLRELSALLGVQVADVQRWGGLHRTWYVVFAVRPETAFPFSSSDFRNLTALNRRALAWGRDPALPPLTKEDGRRALRLVHEFAEANTAVKHTKENGR